MGSRPDAAPPGIRRGRALSPGARHADEAPDVDRRQQEPAVCGIVGLRRFDGRPVDEALLRAMAARLHHRGPDGDGFAIYGDTGVGFGHTRLSIIDVAGSPQPMTSVAAPFHLTYNGEIFNYADVRAELLAAGVELRTRGDTEVLLETLRRDGLRGLDRLHGQFAFACFDERDGTLLLARDRLGILPLYWCEGPGFFAFASEIKALLPVLGEPVLDDEAVEDYLTYRSVPPPRTLFRGVHKLTAGHALRVDAAGRVREETYWALPAALDGAELDGDEAIAAVDAALRRAVAGRLVADVPVGAYLSGGLDSSLTVALMKELRAGGAVETFAAGFADPRFDELPYARQVSEAVGTTHHEIQVTAADFRAHWERLCWHRDGPISEPADVAIFRIAEYARQSVKVLLSGEGADELFAGYPKYAYEPKLGLPLTMPGFLRVPLARIGERMLPLSKARARQAARALTGRDTAERLQTWFAPFTWYERRALHAGYGERRSLGQYERCEGDHLRRMLYVDCHTWLADNLLERGDRMSMAASIENRPPFLDHELVELAFRVSSAMKVRGGSGKWILKEIARRHLPAAIVDRKKVGFRVPLDEWFRDGLKDYAHDLLLGPSSFVSSYLARGPIERMLQDHLRGRRDEQLRLWTLLGLEVWHRAFLRGATERFVVAGAATS
ncbi:MAG: asparagine synthase (glutamine-hydrolyzing) [Planctomycetes bacterium]|nr:asparagine synthase (glutamine-hydrolyzing) [Planctomycetota bacterium]